MRQFLRRPGQEALAQGFEEQAQRLGRLHRPAAAAGELGVDELGAEALAPLDVELAAAVELRGQIGGEIREVGARGVGAGLRWRSVVGPVRVDIAHGIGSPEQGVRLHITIGPDL